MKSSAGPTRTAERMLARERERANLALSAARMGEFDWDVDAGRLTISERMAAVVGLPAGERPVRGGLGPYEHVHADDVESLGQSLADGLGGEGRYQARYRLVRPGTGEVRWIFTAAALAPEKGARRVVGVVRDITAEQTEANARDTLVAELDHRVKNVLASVQSLAAQSARKTTSVDAFLKTFAGRLEAMASAHTLLTATRWRGAEIGNVAAAELGGLAPGQASWRGPDLVLNPRATNALTLALHELATNAVKFGALSTDTGRVEVRWRSLPDGGFELTWTERGGPPVTAPAHRGFGATLLERVTGRELGGAAKIEFRPDGVRAQITADISALTMTPRARAEAPRPGAAEPDTHTGASSGLAAPDSVRGRRILIVEDSVLLAVELEAGLQEAGAEVMGMAANVEEALKLVDKPLDVAVLDANLNGDSVAPVAEALSRRGKPFIIATGYGDAGLPPEGVDAPVVRKPYNVHQIAAAIGEALAKAG